jgi:hypothetical protein
MDISGLFVGLITYGGSAFNRHGEATQTIGRIEAAMAADGLECSSLVSDRDDYSAADFPITRSRLLSSAVFQAWLEFRWRRYLARGRANSLSSLPRDVAVLAVMSIRRVHSYLGPNPFRPAVHMPGARQVIRLLNIDLSHLRVYQAALQANSPGVLVIEDDARLDAGDRAYVALSILLSRIEMNEPSIVNLSESISVTELGVEGIVDSPSSLVGVEGIGISSCSRPVTNTVCANLFSRRFVELLVSDIEKRGLLPVIPIDWRLNRMIMDEWKSGGLDATSCAWITPGIFVQGSMHSSASG